MRQKLPKLDPSLLDDGRTGDLVACSRESEGGQVAAVECEWQFQSIDAENVQSQMSNEMPMPFKNRAIATINLMHTPATKVDRVPKSRSEGVAPAPADKRTICCCGLVKVCGNMEADLGNIQRASGCRVQH